MTGFIVFVTALVIVAVMVAAVFMGMRWVDNNDVCDWEDFTDAMLEARERFSMPMDPDTGYPVVPDNYFWRVSQTTPRTKLQVELREVYEGRSIVVASRTVSKHPDLVRKRHLIKEAKYLAVGRFRPEKEEPKSKFVGEFNRKDTFDSESE